MIHSRTLQSLEFPAIVERLASLCRSMPGRRLALTTAPLPDAAAVRRAAAICSEAAVCAANKAGENVFKLTAFPDISPLLNAARKPGFRPDVEEFWALRNFLDQGQNVQIILAAQDAQRLWPLLFELAASCPFPLQLSAALCRCISDDARITDESSPELFRLRCELRSIHRDCMGKVKDFAKKYNILAYLQDEFITLASDRYVLPLKGNFKGRLQGIIHDWSQTGETCYFEPMFLVNINNRLRELKREERQEEQNILNYLAGLLHDELDETQETLRMLTELDLLQAKLALASLLDGIFINIADGSEGINLIEARHPLLALPSQKCADGNRTFQNSAARPLNIQLRPGEHCLVVTGGNAGGKTVCLKTLGLIAAMSMSALPVPVSKGSHLPWLERMDAFIGDEQSLEDNVSTFTAQIEHLAKAWKHLNANSLVLLDEFGAGTDPAQGAALAQAVLETLIERESLVLAATHFPSLKAYALTNQKTRAASMLFDPETKKPLFKLAYDQVGASQAFAVARKHGLPEMILHRAQQCLLQDGEDTAPLLERLNALAASREKELADLRDAQEKSRQAQKHYQELLTKTRAELCDEVRGKIAELMRAWKEERATARQALKEMSRLRASLLPRPGESAPAGVTSAGSGAFTVGQHVTHTAFRKRAVISSVDERRGRIRLEMGGVSLWANLGDVVADNAGKARSIERAAPVAGSGDMASLRLDVRGHRCEQALSEVEHFLDKAILAGFSTVEIVHGRGTGALRREIHAFLHCFPAVGRYDLAPEDQGGDGMTLVHLR